MKIQKLISDIKVKHIRNKNSAPGCSVELIRLNKIEKSKQKVKEGDKEIEKEIEVEVPTEQVLKFITTFASGRIVEEQNDVKSKLASHDSNDWEMIEDIAKYKEQFKK